MCIFETVLYVLGMFHRFPSLCTMANGLNIIMNTIFVHKVECELFGIRLQLYLVVYLFPIWISNTHIMCSVFSVQDTRQMLSAQLRIRGFETFWWIWFSSTKNNGWLISLFLTDEQRSSITNRRIWVDTQVIQPTRYAYYYINVWWMNRYEGVR